MRDRVVHVGQEQDADQHAPQRVLRDEAPRDRRHAAPAGQAAPEHADGGRADHHEHDQHREGRVLALEEPLPRDPGEAAGGQGRPRDHGPHPCAGAPDLALATGRQAPGDPVLQGNVNAAPASAHTVQSTETGAAATAPRPRVTSAKST